jgi:hypothetical protein
MMKAPWWMTYTLFLLVVASILFVAFVWICPTGTLFELKYHISIRNGMTLQSVERVMGPGTPAESPKVVDRPTQTVRPALKGDKIYFWGKDGMEIYVGFKNGEACDKRFWAPSL